jgi:hypothetical protein
MKVQVHYDRFGTVTSVVSLAIEDGAPPAGVFEMPGCRSFEVELDDSKHGPQDLLEVHTRYRLDLSDREPRLVRIEKGSTGV